ncbi:MAG: MlaA family lipoprotein, partial [Planctomycetota bacterium]
MLAWMGRAIAVALGLVVLCAATGGAEVAAGVVSAAPAPAPAGARPAPAPSAEPSSDDALDALFEEEFANEASGPQADPFETANRKLFAFNEALHDYVFDPMVKGYRLLLPRPARRSLRRAIENLDAPVLVVNDILQMRFRDAAEAVGSFAINLTLGWGGLFDAAAEAGLEMRHADFGQTLARAGVGSGPYLVLPVLGPSTLRDGLG